MVLNRNVFFLLLILLAAIPFVAYKLLWLSNSVRTNGTMGFTGKSQTGQLIHIYSVISFNVGRDTIWFNGNDNILFEEGATVPVRYPRNNPQAARIDTFAAIWGDTVVYGGIPLVILLAVFFHPAIVPRRSKIKISRKKPFVLVYADGH